MSSFNRTKTEPPPFLPFDKYSLCIAMHDINNEKGFKMTHDELHSFLTWPSEGMDSRDAFRALVAAINTPSVYVEKYDGVARGTNIGALRLYDTGELRYTDNMAHPITNFSNAQMVLLKIAINKRIKQDRIAQAARTQQRTR